MTLRSNSKAEMLHTDGASFCYLHGIATFTWKYFSLLPLCATIESFLKWIIKKAQLIFIRSVKIHRDYELIL